MYLEHSEWRFDFQSRILNHRWQTHSTAVLFNINIVFWMPWLTIFYFVLDWGDVHLPNSHDQHSNPSIKFSLYHLHENNPYDKNVSFKSNFIRLGLNLKALIQQWKLKAISSLDLWTFMKPNAHIWSSEEFKHYFGESLASELRHHKGLSKVARDCLLCKYFDTWNNFQQNFISILWQLLD